MTHAERFGFATLERVQIAEDAPRAVQARAQAHLRAHIDELRKVTA